MASPGEGTDTVRARAMRPRVDRALPRRSDPDPHVYPAAQNMLLAARALGLGATLTTLYLQFEKEAEAALGLPPNVHSYALLPIGYPMGRFGSVRRIALADVVYEDRWASLAGIKGPVCWVYRMNPSM